jgi:hypothetical protein
MNKYLRVYVIVLGLILFFAGGIGLGILGFYGLIFRQWLDVVIPMLGIPALCVGWFWLIDKSFLTTR